eukprot:Lankesteria_metandrocarpae@DN5434_c0_g1_i14.p1
MKRVSVNVLSLLGFLALWSPFMRTVEAAVICTGTAVCTDMTLHDVSGLCEDLHSTWCVCAASHTNNVTSGVCVEGEVCTGSAIGTCTGTQHHADAVCVDGNPTWCKCAAGYTNNATGVCVEGEVCTGSAIGTCTGTQHHADAVCVDGSPTWCKCAAGY